MQGYVVKVSAEGFGFVRADDGTGDVYLPSQLLGNAEVGVGNYVDFTVATDQGNGKRFATSLRLAEEAASKQKFRGAVIGNLASTRGFGFVKNEDGRGDAFLHVSIIEQSGLELPHGDAVVYEVDDKAPEPGRCPRVTKVQRAA